MSGSRTARLLGLGLVTVAALVTWGHVGSPDVFLDSHAGPYPVRIIIRPPAVVPGRAEITVRTAAQGVSEVAVQPVVWNAGPEGPPPDIARRVPGDPTLWSAQLWLMRQTSYSVRVEIAGAAGRGVALVPVVAVATRRLPMQRGMATALAALAIFLLAGALTAVGAAVRESELPPGEEPSPARRRRARQAVAATAVLLALALWGGRAWWRRVDEQFARGLYRPYPVKTQVLPNGAGRRLHFTVADPSWGEGPDWVALMPDHGKLMHLFLVAVKGTAFAHLHPVPVGSKGFEVALPPLPVGAYRLYADVTHENGLAETLTAAVELPAAGAPPGSAGSAAPVLVPDPDDSFRTDALPVASRTAAALGDGRTMTWEGAAAPLRADQDAGLRFVVRGADGNPLAPGAIEPYMGMLAHAAVVRDDGQVFVHLHPEGTISMAAQQFFANRGSGGASSSLDHSRMAGMAGMDRTGGVLTFPWAFPKPGHYRLWVQVKIAGQVRTGVFAATVAP